MSYAKLGATHNINVNITKLVLLNVNLSMYLTYTHYTNRHILGLWAQPLIVNRSVGATVIRRRKKITKFSKTVTDKFEKPKPKPNNF